MDERATMLLRHAQHVLSSMKTIFDENSEELDVIVKCSDGIVATHTLILASLSQMLKTYLETNAKEPMLIIPDLTRKDFDTLHLCLFNPEALDASHQPVIVQTLKCLNANDQVMAKLQANERLDSDADMSDDALGGVPTEVDDDDSDVDQEARRHTKGKLSLIECHFCPKRYHHAKARNKHMLMEHLKQCQDSGWFYPCQSCSMSFTTSSGREKHFQRVHANGATPEEVAPTGMGHQEDLTCPFEGCNSTFQHLIELKQHARGNHPEKDTHCLICGVDCHSRQAIHGHIQGHKGPEGRHLYTCEYCQLKTMSEYSLVTHKREVHSKNKVFKCRFCQKQFRNAKFCSNHERKHESGQIVTNAEHKCTFTDEADNVCGRSFSNKHNLERHAKSHTQRTVFSCDTCSMTFVDSTRLKHHKWIHTGHKPYKCSSCGKGFRHKSHLKNHSVQEHGEAKQFSCQVCDKAFLYAYQLRTHMRIHADQGGAKGQEVIGEDQKWLQTIYQCALCQNVFENYEAFQKHSHQHASAEETTSSIASTSGNKDGEDEFVIIYDE